MKFTFEEKGKLVEVIERPDSSNIKEVHWENDKMYVTFNAGGIYEYTGVPKRLFEAFRTAPSAGKYFHATIKGHYPYAKISSGFGG